MERPRPSHFQKYRPSQNRPRAISRAQNVTNRSNTPRWSSAFPALHRSSLSATPPWTLIASHEPDNHPAQCANTRACLISTALSPNKQDPSREKCLLYPHPQNNKVFSAATAAGYPTKVRAASLHPPVAQETRPDRRSYRKL